MRLDPFDRIELNGFRTTTEKLMSASDEYEARSLVHSPVPLLVRVFELNTSNTSPALGVLSEQAVGESELLLEYLIKSKKPWMVNARTAV